MPGVESLSFSYDADSRITHITNGLDSSMPQSFGYDALNRLVSVSSGADNGSYSYDADGNRLNAMINGVGWTYTVSGTSNRLVHATNGTWSGPYSYNANGDMLGTTHRYWTYGPFGRLRTTTPLAGSPVTTYEIGAQGQRLRKYTSTNSTYFVPGTNGGLLAEDQNGDWMDYVWLNGRLVTIVKSGGIYPVHSDQTGRPEAITDGSGDILWRAHNWAFNRTIITNAWGAFNIGFPGQYSDTESGDTWDMWYNGNRDYSAWLGRYIESDPIGLAGGINTYVYADNNPISNVDPLGLCDNKKKCAQASAVVAAIGQQLSRTGNITAVSGIGLIGVSAIAAYFAPEDFPAEGKGFEVGIGMVEVGGRLSIAGSALQGYARNGLAGALEQGGASAMINVIDKAYSGWLFNGGGEAGTTAIAGLLDQAPEAVKQEAAACIGN